MAIARVHHSEHVILALERDASDGHDVTAVTEKRVESRLAIERFEQTRLSAFHDPPREVTRVDGKDVSRRRDGSVATKACQPERARVLLVDKHFAVHAPARLHDHLQRARKNLGELERSLESADDSAFNAVSL